MYDPNDMNLAAIDEKVLKVWAEIGASSTIYKGSKSRLWVSPRGDLESLISQLTIIKYVYSWS